jgi:phosphoribosyl 1,2-cyclic phosphate phosphodiesterase
MPSLDLTFLGTGTSHGIPVIGCDCPVCRSTDPRDHRTRTSLLVKAPDLHFVIDTSPDFRGQCLRERISRLDAALFTHAHTDHIMGFDDMRRFCELQDLKMPVFASAATMEGLRNTFRYAFDEPQPWKNYLRLAPEVIGGPFRLGETEIVPVDLPHGKFTTTGYVFLRGGRKLLAYFTDCAEVPPEAVEAARGVDVLVLDALRERPHPTHMTIAQAMEAAAAIAPGDCYFTHLCHDVSHAALQAALPGSRHVAHDGLTLTAGASR